MFNKVADMTATIKIRLLRSEIGEAPLSGVVVSEPGPPVVVVLEVEVGLVGG